MKKLLSFFTLIALLLSIFPSIADAGYVRGYYRKDGTYVNGYYRNSSKSYRSYTPKVSYPTYNNHYVNGYYRKDGTYVDGYYRTNPNGVEYDNYSYRGNYGSYAQPIYTPSSYSNAEIEKIIEEKEIDLNKKREKFEYMQNEWDNIEYDINQDSRYDSLSSSRKFMLISEKRSPIQKEYDKALNDYQNALNSLKEWRNYKDQHAVLETITAQTYQTQATSYPAGYEEWEQAKREAAAAIEKAKSNMSSVQSIQIQPTTIDAQNIKTAQLGNYSDGVRNLQLFLQNQGHYTGSIDGVMSLQTLKALRAYQFNK